MFYQILFSPHMKGSVIISHEHGVYESRNSGGDYVIPIWRGKILTGTTWPDFTPRIHAEIKPRPLPPKAGQPTTRHLYAFSLNFSL